MRYEKFEGKYIPKFESKELLLATVFSKAFAGNTTCPSQSDCSGLVCPDCMLHDRDCCIAYLKQHHECLENYLKNLGKTSKEKEEKGEETMENDFPKLGPGMAITFTNNNKLGFMTSETQIMYVYPNNSYSAIVDGWDLLGDRENTDVPYSRIKAVYATSDTDNETKEVESLTPCRLARMSEAISNDEDLADLEGVKLVWCRQEYKEMTVEDIEKELGYKIKVVGAEK